MRQQYTEEKKQSVLKKLLPPYNMPIPVIIETAPLSELELGEYCRKKGIYTHDIQMWKDEIIQNLSGQKAGNLEDKKQAKKDKDRIKSLEKELRRKDKALAETAALLVLRKKLQALLTRGFMKLQNSYFI